MAHYNSYDSFKTKKSLDKKNKTKDKLLNKKVVLPDDFIINTSDSFGVVVEVKYNDAYILYDNEIVLGKLRRDINAVLNQIIFPGDRVILNKVNNTYYINNLLSRKTLLTRVKKDSTRLDTSVGVTKNIAANIDLAVIVVSASQPPLHPKFIDRYLMILENSGIDVVICLNKCDLMTDEDKLLKVYEDLNIPVVYTSTYLNKGIDDLIKYLDGRQAILVGNSGVGKSSLTNAIMDSDLIKTSHVSSKSKRGRHTTTSSKYYVWNDNSSIIDTPGIRSLDISSFDINEIQDYFKEFNDYKDLCKYNDCLHFEENEDDCMIKKALKDNKISKSRYDSYIRIISSLDKK